MVEKKYLGPEYITNQSSQTGQKLTTTAMKDTDIIQRCRDVSIHGLLGLQNNGRRVMVRCPFHSDGTASMAIYPNNGFHCFGCLAHGHNAVDFVILLDGNKDKKVAFNNAINTLKDLI